MKILIIFLSILSFFNITVTICSDGVPAAKKIPSGHLFLASRHNSYGGNKNKFKVCNSEKLAVRYATPYQHGSFIPSTLINDANQWFLQTSDQEKIPIEDAKEYFLYKISTSGRVAFAVDNAGKWYAINGIESGKLGLSPVKAVNFSKEKPNCVIHENVTLDIPKEGNNNYLRWEVAHGCFYSCGNEEFNDNNMSIDFEIIRQYTQPISDNGFYLTVMHPASKKKTCYHVMRIKGNVEDLFKHAPLNLCVSLETERPSDITVYEEEVTLKTGLTGQLSQIYYRKNGKKITDNISSDSQISQKNIEKLWNENKECFLVDKYKRLAWKIVKPSPYPFLPSFIARNFIVVSSVIVGMAGVIAMYHYSESCKYFFEDLIQKIIKK